MIFTEIQNNFWMIHKHKSGVRSGRLLTYIILVASECNINAFNSRALRPENIEQLANETNKYSISKLSFVRTKREMSSIKEYISRRKKETSNVQERKRTAHNEWKRIVCFPIFFVW